MLGREEFAFIWHRGACGMVAKGGRAATADEALAAAGIRGGTGEDRLVRSGSGGGTGGFDGWWRSGDESAPDVGTADDDPLRLM